MTFINYLLIVSLLIVFHALGSSVCTDDREATCAFQKAFSQDVFPTDHVALELLQQKAIAEALKNTKSMDKSTANAGHSESTSKGRGKDFATEGNHEGARGSYMNTARSGAKAKGMQRAFTAESISADTGSLAFTMRKKMTPSVHLLAENEFCWHMGWDQASRDTMCQAGLVCARKGFDERSFGCTNDHCCSQDSWMFRMFKACIESTSAFILLMLCFICCCDSTFRNSLSAIRWFKK